LSGVGFPVPIFHNLFINSVLVDESRGKFTVSDDKKWNVFHPLVYQQATHSSAQQDDEQISDG